ncbi:MAG: DUF433 domain-containing protein [Cytophagales bacterium]|nr:DUF433 domain-containing protein [Cytophagales bacterium]
MKKNEVYKYISSNPKIMHGKPCVNGTRIHVSLVVSMLADGMTEEQILKEYPSLRQCAEITWHSGLFFCPFSSLQNP